MIAVFVVLTAFVVSTVSAQEEAVYFVPQHGTITGGSCNNITVELRVNTTDAINSWNTFVSFNPACVNITNVTYAWTPSALWTHHGNYAKIGDTKMVPCVDGDMLLATLTIHCEAWGCISPLDFSGIDNVTRQISCAGTNLATTWQNGTVTNEPAPSPTAYDGDGGDGAPPKVTPIATPAITPTPIMTPKPEATPILTPTSTLIVTPTPTPSPTPKPWWKIPGFEAVFAILGLLAVVYLLRRRKE